MRNYKLIFLLPIVVLLSACRGQPTEKTPIYTQYNMYWQEKFQAQDYNPIFADGRSDRLPPEGTVPRGKLRTDTEYYFGVDAEGDYVQDIPVELTKSFLLRGQERYQIYCTPCHGGTGEMGIVGDYGLLPISLQSDVVREYPDGQIYSAIYNGVRAMPSYHAQINVEDRWAIVAYVRALQRSQRASEQDLQTLDIDINATTTE